MNKNFTQQFIDDIKFFFDYDIVTEHDLRVALIENSYLAELYAAEKKLFEYPPANNAIGSNGEHYYM